MQFLKLTGASPGMHAGTRSLGKRICALFRSGNEGGQALVEFAVILPVLLLLVTGMMTFGIALNSYLELTDAVAIGARNLAISRGQNTNPCSVAATTIRMAAPYLNPGQITLTFVLATNSDGATTTYSGSGSSSGGVSCPTSGWASGGLVQGTPAQVTATYPCNLSVYGHNYAPSCTMTAQVTEILQ